jgi:hypothetical protein
MECIDLQTLGDFYFGSDKAAGPLSHDPWMRTLPCRKAVVYPFGADLLAVEVDGRPYIAGRLRSIDGVQLYQDGDHEKTFVFPLEQFEQVAAVVRPRRHKRLTQEQRAASAARLAPFQFAAGHQPVGAERA